jgi:small-conductance mechanosensitive channel
MAIPVAEFLRELDEAKAELDAVQSQMQSLTARETELAKVVQGWQAIIAAKRKQNGEPTNQVRDLEVNVADGLGIEDSASVSEEADNKTQFVRERICANASSGVTVADLKTAATQVGMSHAPSWPYGALNRLKKKGEVVKRRGRFYPTEALLNSKRNGSLMFT